MTRHASSVWATCYPSGAWPSQQEPFGRTVLTLEERFHEAMLKFFEIEVIGGSDVVEYQKAYYCANRRPENMPDKVCEILGVTKPQKATRLRGRPSRSDDQPTAQYLRRLEYLTEYYVALYCLVDEDNLSLSFCGEKCIYKISRKLKFELYNSMRRDHGPLPDFKTFNNILAELPKDEVFSYRVMNAVAARLREMKRAAAEIG